MKRALIFAAVAILGVASAWADQASANEPKRVTLRSDSPISIKLALERVLAGTGLAIRFDQGANPDTQVTAFSFVDAPIASAVKWLSAGAGFEVREEAGGYAIIGRPAAFSAPEQAAELAKKPAVGMRKPEVTAVLGKPGTKGLCLEGDEVWVYPDWILGFQKDRCIRVEPARQSVVFVPADKLPPSAERARPRTQEELVQYIRDRRINEAIDAVIERARYEKRVEELVADRMPEIEAARGR